MESELEKLKDWFKKIKDFEETDLFMKRMVWVECITLPMNAWFE